MVVVTVRREAYAEAICRGYASQFGDYVAGPRQARLLFVGVSTQSPLPQVPNWEIFSPPVTRQPWLSLRSDDL